MCATCQGPLPIALLIVCAVGWAFTLAVLYYLYGRNLLGRSR